MCQTCDETWYVLCAHNVVDSWCARHVMKYGTCNVVDIWCARQVMKCSMFCVLVMWWIVGVPGM